ncbi:cupredoxin domain-containing protein [Paenibacillus turpanensis]|uniref:cupredoxin domain-containing protein n=1 Tax=Paenibacillus turpanensis TaxID=2689078 RepID=UPI00140DD306|nr:cupredoxin domain-containing protein [Paenibacillus turpanensis]
MFMKKAKTLILPAMLMLLFSLLAGCSSEPAKPIDIVITAKDMMFTPDRITVDKGSSIKLTFRNQEGVVNDLMMKGTDVMIQDVGPNQEKSTTFTADRAGTFTIMTSAPGMENMTADFIVKE